MIKVEIQASYHRNCWWLSKPEIRQKFL